MKKEKDFQLSTIVLKPIFYVYKEDHDLILKPSKEILLELKKYWRYIKFIIL